MRFLLITFATAVSVSACEKDPALSNTTNQVAPASARPAEGINPPASSSASPVNTATASRSSSAVGTKGDIAPAANVAVSVAGVSGSGVPSGVVPSNGVPAPGAHTDPASAPLARPTVPVASDEGNGEPMDDVDDDVVSATDKSGVDNAEAEEAPTGPLDEDPEGADIDLRE